MKTRIFFLLLFLSIISSGCDESHVIIIDPSPALRPLEKDMGDTCSLIELKKVVSGIDIGKTLGHSYRASYMPFTWSPNWESLIKERLVKGFYNEFDNTGYDTIGGPETLFDDYESPNPSILIGAKIIDVKYNMDTSPSYETDLLLEASYEISWQVYSRKSRAVIGNYTTKGYHKKDYKRDHFTQETYLGFIDTGLMVSVKNLLANQEFVKLLCSQPEDTAVNNSTSIKKVEKATTLLSEDAISVRASVLMVKSKGGHGSGFVISADGYAITNEHVVRDSSIVRVQLATGKEVLADVVYTNAKRDVALLKIEQAGLNPLAINEDIVKVGDDIYAMGAPLDESLSNTLSKGIVSAHRTEDDLTFIQSDVNIMPGNSGGPLMDKYGNVIGITAGGVAFADAVMVGLNFFIPITDALDSLGIELTD